MLSHKIGLIIAGMLVSTVTLADSSFKVDWTLHGTGEPVTLNKDSYSFKVNGTSCEVTRAIKEYSPDMGLGLTESRSVTCTVGKKALSQSVLCARRQTEEAGEIELNGKKLQLTCNTK